MGARKYLVGVLVVVLLIWGPIDHSWPAWLLIRMGYLIAIPLATWFLLGWIWRVWQPDAATEDRLERALGGATGGVFVVMAILEAMAVTILATRCGSALAMGWRQLATILFCRGQIGQPCSC